MILIAQIGVRTSWSRLLAGNTGVVGLNDDRFKTIPSRVAGVVPRGNKADGGWNPEEWLEKGVCLQPI
jgi:3-oxoacyl-[acyl-carrier-protein] synthase II